MKIEPDVDLRRIGAVNLMTNRYRARKRRALDIASEALARCSKPYLAISGGKDSVAMAGIVNDAACEAGRDFVLWAHVSDASFPGTEETILEVGEKLGRAVVLSRSPVSAFDVVGKQSHQAFGNTGFFYDSIRDFVLAGRYDLAFIGVRSAESKRRKKACLSNGPFFHSSIPTPIWKCFPLIWFEVEDVASVLVEYELPIHPIYSQMSVQNRAIRLGYATALDLVNKGTIVFLRLNYPDLYQRLLMSHPEVAQFT